MSNEQRAISKARKAVAELAVFFYRQQRDATGQRKRKYNRRVDALLTMCNRLIVLEKR